MSANTIHAALDALGWRSLLDASEARGRILAADLARTREEIAKLRAEVEQARTILRVVLGAHADTRRPLAELARAIDAADALLDRDNVIDLTQESERPGAA